MHRLPLSPRTIQEKIYFWHSKYSYNNGAFIRCENLKFEQQKKLFDNINLKKNELPVLVFNPFQKHCVINTTERFIKVVKGKEIDSIEYEDFAGVLGFNDVPTAIKVISILENGDITKMRLLNASNIRTKRLIIQGKEEIRAFGFILQNDPIKYWMMPTHSEIFNFFSFSYKCGYIGRKYIIEK